MIGNWDETRSEGKGRADRGGREGSVGGGVCSIHPRLTASSSTRKAS